MFITGIQTLRPNEETRSQQTSVVVLITPQPTPPPIVVTSPPIVVTSPPMIVTVPLQGQSASSANSSSGSGASSGNPTISVQQSCPPVSGVLANTWTKIQNRIGCSRSQPVYGQVVVEDFEHGKMLWRQPIDLGTATQGYALVLLYSGSWKRYSHTPYRGDGGTSCPEAASSGRPTGGFGMMWCDMPEIRQSLGNAVSGEKNFQSGNVMMDFDNGFMVYTTDGAVYAFYNDGRWEQW